MEVLGPPLVRRTVLVHDPFDLEAFETVLGRAAGLQLLLAESDYPSAPDLAFDLFCSFYKYFAQVLPEDRLPEGGESRVELLARALELREHRKLRTMTRLRSLESVLATELVLEALLQELATEREEPATAEEGPEMEEEADDEETVVEVATHRIRGILQEAEEELRGPAELVATWSEGPGEERRLPTETKVRFMRELVRNPRLGRIAHLFGRYRRLALRQRELRTMVRSPEVVEVVRGGDAARALPAEFVDLSVPEREDLFYAKLVTNSLLLYSLERREREPRPLYLCLDNSGSMAGDREVWAKAVSLALGHLALSEGRPVEVIHFGDAADPLHVIAFDPDDDGPTRLAKVEDVASYFLGGGTNFEKPLAHVLEALEAEGGRECDVLFVSDGLCPISTAFTRTFLRAKAEGDVRLTSVLIGGEAASLEPLSDEVYYLEEVLREGEQMASRLAMSLWEGVPGSEAPRGGPEDPWFDHFADRD